MRVREWRFLAQVHWCRNNLTHLLLRLSDVSYLAGPWPCFLEWVHVAVLFYFSRVNTCVIDDFLIQLLLEHFCIILVLSPIFHGQGSVCLVDSACQVIELFGLSHLDVKLVHCLGEGAIETL